MAFYDRSSDIESLAAWIVARIKKFSLSTIAIVAFGVLIFQGFVVRNQMVEARSAIDDWLLKNRSRLEQSLFLGSSLPIHELIGEMVNSRGKLIQSIDILDNAGIPIYSFGNERKLTRNYGYRHDFSSLRLVYKDSLRFADSKVGDLVVSASYNLDDFLKYTSLILVALFLTVVLFHFHTRRLISELSERLSSLIKNLTEADREKAIAVSRARIASQVAHDIRSPLSALSLVMQGMSEIPEDRRLLIRNAVHRINDIANDLLRQGKSSDFSAKNSEPKVRANFTQGAHQHVTTILLPALVDSIVSEKRIQFREKIGVKIEADLRESFGTFVNVSPTELGRVISNLVNNSVEAFKNGSGEVLVTVRGYGTYAKLEIEDNGIGINDEILRQLGSPGVSFGKNGSESGNGLGIHHAKSAIEDWGGKFSITSQVARGTKVEISIPRATTPSWFAEMITLAEETTVVAVDDDLSIHQIWSERLFELQTSKGQKLQLLSFTSGAEFKILELNENMIFLMDFELLNQKETGIDLILNRNLASRSILVTSRHDESSIREICEKHKIRILPKSLAGIVPIVVKPKPYRPRAILIDDDNLVHLSWQLSAKQAGKQVVCFDSVDQFEADCSLYDAQTPVYIDVNLGSGVRGEEVSRKVFELGFKEIYLATGFSEDGISKPDFVEAVVGKDPPEILN